MRINNKLTLKLMREVINNAIYLTDKDNHLIIFDGDTNTKVEIEEALTRFRLLGFNTYELNIGKDIVAVTVDSEHNITLMTDGGFSFGRYSSNFLEPFILNYEQYVNLRFNAVQFDGDSAEAFNVALNSRYIDGVTLSGTLDFPYISHIFHGCDSLKQCKLIDLEIKNSEELPRLFCNQSIQTLYIDGLRSESVNTIDSLCKNSYSLENVTIVDTYLPNVKKANTTFGDCYRLKKVIIDQSNQIGNIQSMDGMFQNCHLLEEIDIRGLGLNNVGSAEATFHTCVNLKKINENNTIEMAGTNVIFDSTFYSCLRLEHITIKSSGKLMPLSMDFMFSCCENLKTVILDGIDTSKTDTFSHTFSECKELSRLNISSIKTTKARSLAFMFYSCKDFDLSGFVIENNAIIRCMFCNETNEDTKRG